MCFFIGSTGSNQLFMPYFITGSVFAKRCKVEHLDITPVGSVFQKQMHSLPASLRSPAGRQTRLGGNPRTLKLRCFIRTFLLGIARCQTLYRLPALSS